MIYNKKTPGIIASLQNLLDYVSGELELIERVFNGQDLLKLETSYSAPAKPRDGMVVLADGTEWNPGSGAGIYGYYGGSWKKLG